MTDNQLDIIDSSLASYKVFLDERTNKNYQYTTEEVVMKKKSVKRSFNLYLKKKETGNNYKIRQCVPGF